MNGVGSDPCVSVALTGRFRVVNKTGPSLPTIREHVEARGRMRSRSTQQAEQRRRATRIGRQATGGFVSDSYVIRGNEIEFVSVEEVSKHDY